MTEYRRNFVKGGSYFFTVALADLSQRLLVDHIDNLRQAFRQVKALYPFSLDAIVVLPEHLHCIWTLPPGDANYPERWRRIKALFSRSLPNSNPRSSSKMLKGEPASGSAVIGNTRCATRRTGTVTLIIFITIRSNMNMLIRWQIGGIRRFIGMLKLPFIPAIGVEMGWRVRENLVRCERGVRFDGFDDLMGCALLHPSYEDRGVL